MSFKKLLPVLILSCASLQVSAGQVPDGHYLSKSSTYESKTDIQYVVEGYKEYGCKNNYRDDLGALSVEEGIAIPMGDYATPTQINGLKGDPSDELAATKASQECQNHSGSEVEAEFSILTESTFNKKTSILRVDSKSFKTTCVEGKATNTMPNGDHSFYAKKISLDQRIQLEKAFDAICDSNIENPIKEDKLSEAVGLHTRLIAE